MEIFFPDCIYMGDPSEVHSVRPDPFGIIVPRLYGSVILLGDTLTSRSPINLQFFPSFPPPSLSSFYRHLPINFFLSSHFLGRESETEHTAAMTAETQKEENLDKAWQKAERKFSK